MQINQMQLAYQPEEDRMLYRISADDMSELRFWLSRRCVKALWQLLLKMVEQDDALKTQFDPDMRREVIEMQHQGYVGQGDFSQHFADQARQFPFGEQPLLVSKLELKQVPDGGHVLSLYSTQGKGIDIALDARLLHLFCKLLQDAVAASDWDMLLKLVHEAQPAAAISRQKLN
jgi:hypothetical protein